MGWVYIDITASNIPQMKITAVTQWTATFNIQRKSKKCWCLLRNLSSGLFDHKKNPGLFQDSFQIPGLSRTFQDFPELLETILISVNWVYFSKLDLTVLFNKNGLQVSPNNTRVKRRLINSGWLLNTSSNQMNRKRSLCSDATSVWRNACLISAISLFFRSENAIRY